MIVPLSKMKEVAAIAKGVADKTKAGDPRGEGTTSARSSTAISGTRSRR
jgi:aldehyde dehydrogenase (NAD+)